jgi:hypothetical protein
MNRQQRRAARFARGREPREERPLCEAAQGQLRALFNAALDGGADPLDLVGGIRDLGGGRFEVRVEPMRELLAGLDAWGAEGTARIAEGLRSAAPSMGFPVVVVAPAGVYVMTARYHALSRGGSA